MLRQVIAKKMDKSSRHENHAPGTEHTLTENPVLVYPKQKSTIPAHPFVNREKLHPFVAISPKLKMSTPGDKWEQEADRVAGEVLGMKEAELKTGKKPPDISVKGSSGGTEVDSPLASEIQNLSGGQSLTRGAQDFFEPRFGMDLSRVRVHTDSKAERLAEGLSARAFTYRNHVVFGKGEYAPGSGDGRRLIAHELAHVGQGKIKSASILDTVQQQTGQSGRPSYSPHIGPPRVQGAAMFVNFFY